MAFPPRGLWHRTAIPYGWFGRWRTRAGFFSSKLLDQALWTFSIAEKAGSLDTTDGVLSPRGDSLEGATATDTKTGVVPIFGDSAEGGATIGRSGYKFGGLDSGSSNYNTISALRYAGEACVDLNATIGTSLYAITAAESPEKTYLAGGTDGTTPTTATSAFSFSTETASTLSAVLNTGSFTKTALSAPKAAVFWGGNLSSGYSDRIESLYFATETMGPTSTGVHVASSGASGVQDAIHGWLIGGNYGAQLSTITKISFLTYASFGVVNGLSTARSYAPSASTPTKGWLINGSISVSPYALDTAQSFEYSTEWVSSPTTSIASTIRSGAALTESATKAYCLGTNSYDSSIEALTYSSETFGNLSASLTLALAGSAGSQSPASGAPPSAFDTVGGVLTDFIVHAVENLGLFGSKGYFGGGSSNSGVENTVDKLTFPTEAVARLTAVLATARSMSTGISSLSSAYFLGGNIDYEALDGVTYDTESAINPAATALSGDSTPGSGMSSYTHGYTTTGHQSNNAIRRLQYSDETASTISATMQSGVRYASGIHSALAGYVCGGTTFGVSLTRIEKLLFSTETRTTISATLATARRQLAGVFSETHGYLCGGFNDSVGYVDQLDGLVFSTEAAINPSTTLSINRYDLNPLSAPSAGYFSTFDDPELFKFLFSTETAASAGAAFAADAARNSPGVTQQHTRAATAGEVSDYSWTQNQGGSDIGEAATASTTSVADKILNGDGAADGLSTVATVDATKSSVFNEGISNPSTSTDSHNGLTITPRDSTEAATSVSTQSVQAAFVSDSPETSTATSTHGAQAGFVSTASEVAISVDTKEATAVFVSAKDETTTGVETVGGDISILQTGDITETGAPIDTKEGTATWPVYSTESAMADAVVGGLNVIAATIANAVTSAWSSDSLRTQAADSVDSATADDTKNAIAEFYPQIIEPASSIDSSTGGGSQSVTSEAAGAAGSTATISAFGTSAFHEASTLTCYVDIRTQKAFDVVWKDTYDIEATTAQAAAKDIVFVRSEVATATDAQSTIASLVAVSANTVTANDSLDALVTRIASALESATAAAAHSAQGELNAAITEAALALTSDFVRLASVLGVCPVSLYATIRPQSSLVAQLAATKLIAEITTQINKTAACGKISMHAQFSVEQVVAKIELSERIDANGKG